MALQDYRLRARIGGGEDGVCYLGVDAQGREVVVHYLKRIAADEDRRAILLSRRAIIGLLPAGSRGVREDGLREEIPYVVMEGGGRALSSVVARGGLELDEALSVGAKIARTLRKAHTLGLIHGALTPSVVVLDEDGDPVLEMLGCRTGAALATETDLDDDSVPPEGSTGTPEADAWALGRLLRELLDAKADWPPNVEKLVTLLLAEAPAQRARLEDAVVVLGREVPDDRDVESTQSIEREATSPGRRATTRGDGQAPPVEQIGRFRLVRVLGRGANGVVCEGKDIASGARVAVKLLSQHKLGERGRRRFHKEARVLEGLVHPQLARFVEADCDGPQPYLVIEYCEGRTLKQLMNDVGQPLPPAQALAIGIEMARGLAAVHTAGLVHRDIKPDNVMVTEDASGAHAKLIDFGLARHLETQGESLEITRDGALLGTPYYMAPEQAAGEPVDARADVYALGATLFHALAGQPPFHGATPGAVLAQILKSRAPSLLSLNPAVPPALAALVDGALSQLAEGRPADGGEFLRALEELSLGAPTAIADHPQAPAKVSDRVLTYRFEWKLPGTPRKLWPYVSNTDRLNRAIGLGAIDFDTRSDAGTVKRFGELQVAGLNLSWREHPYEWVEERRMGILREFSRGPFLWLRSVVELEPDGDDHTIVTQEIQVDPRGVMGRAAAALEVGRKAKRGLDKVYKRIGALVGGELKQREHARVTDAFEGTERISGDAERRLAKLEEELVARGVSLRACAALGDLVRDAAPQEVARLRPASFARRFDLPTSEALAALLHAAAIGILEVQWDILCPTCRIPSQLQDTLRVLEDHGRCEACDLDFKLDLAGSVELVFRPHPQIREADRGVYCIGSPGHSPHIAAQVRLAPGERMQLDLALSDGAYRLAGRGLPFTLDFRVDPRARIERWDLCCSSPPARATARVLSTRRQQIVLTNDTNVEHLVRVERRAPRADAITAARVAALPLFRQLFPGEVLGDGQLVSVSWVTLLRLSLRGVDAMYGCAAEPRVFEVLHKAWRQVQTLSGDHGGAMVKVDGDGALCSFPDVPAALRAATEISRALMVTQNLALLPVLALHAGPALMLTLNDRLDYFGHTTRELGSLLEEAGEPGTIVVSENVALDPEALDDLGSRWTVEPRALLGHGVANILRPSGPTGVSSPDDEGDVTAPDLPGNR